MNFRFTALLITASIICLAGCGTGGTVPTTSVVPLATTSAQAIKHVVVIFNENESFDHYFGTYPQAVNGPGEPVFIALPGTPPVDGLSAALLSQNPNASNPVNGAGAVNPFRLSRSHAATADQDHGYLAEQKAFHDGAMDQFPLSVGAADSPTIGSGPSVTTGLTMGYYDGNTVTALWNYAQHYAMSDASFGTTFGPSTVGAINLVSGQTNGAVDDGNAGGVLAADGSGGYTVIGDPQPVDDVCSNSAAPTIHMTGRNIGDMLNDAGVSWGFFQGGFDVAVTNGNGTSGCGRSHKSAITMATVPDHMPHHQPFQYYASTSNPKHVRPASAATVAKPADTATHHQYDLHDFLDALAVNNFPAVSFLKAAAYQDGHAGYSDPLDEQAFVVGIVNALEKRPDWNETVVIIAYDDSDGWYDHVSQVVNGSRSEHDAYSKRNLCGEPGQALPGINAATEHAMGRCGYGPRLPLLVISPWAKPNFVDSTRTDQTSILRFIEDTFLGHQRLGQGSFDAVAGSLENMLDFSRGSAQNTGVVQLDPDTGLVVTTK